MSEEAGKFARYHAWMLFAVGGENLVKAWALCTPNHRPNLPQPQNTFPFPPTSKDESENWIDAIASGAKTGQAIQNFGTLNTWIQPLKKNDQSPLRKAGADYLQECRNREAHQYIATTRQSRYNAIPFLLLPFFNDLLEEMIKCGHPLEHRPDVVT